VTTEVRHLRDGPGGQSNKQHGQQEQHRRAVAKSFAWSIHTFLPWWRSRSTALVSLLAHPGHGGVVRPAIPSIRVPREQMHNHTECAVVIFSLLLCRLLPAL
jgi:hypothetical protein